MSQFRKKPVVITARQWDGTYSGMNALMTAFPEMERVDASCHPTNDTVRYWRIRSLEGPMEVSKGDWIIKGIKGEFYPCKPDIFAATYEAVSPLPEYRKGFDEAPSTFNQEDAGAGVPAGTISDEMILHRWDTHVGELSGLLPITDKDKIAFARAVLYEADRASRGAGASPAAGVEWTTWVSGGIPCFTIGNQSFKLDYDNSDGTAEWMRSMLEKALSRLAAQVSASVPSTHVLVPKEPTPEIISAMASSHAYDDEGPFPSLLDLIGFSGENKTRTVLKAAYKAALSALPGGASVEQGGV